MKRLRPSLETGRGGQTMQRPSVCQAGVFDLDRPSHSSEGGRPFNPVTATRLRGVFRPRDNGGLSWIR